jgi:hypothetical protein
VFNLVGPLCNPAGATVQVIGVGRPTVREAMAEAAFALGASRVLVVSGRIAGDEGRCFDELSLFGPTDVIDVTSAGTIDISASILGELHEETGQSPSEFRIVPGYHLTRWNALLSFGLELVSPLPADALRERIMQHISPDPDSELIDAVIVRSAAEARRAGVHPYTGVLLEWLFAQR